MAKKNTKGNTNGYKRKTGVFGSDAEAYLGSLFQMMRGLKRQL